MALPLVLLAGLNVSANIDARLSKLHEAVLSVNIGDTNSTQHFSSAQTSCSSIVIAHGVNLKEHVDWSFEQGTNGIEMDIHFNAMGVPTEFHHGGKCDCTASSDFSRDNMCRVFTNVCSGRTPAREMLNHIANHASADKLALLYMDTKTDDLKNDQALTKGGEELAKLLVDTVFSSTSKFKGVVNFGAPKAKSWVYMKSGVNTFKSNAPQILDAGRVIFAYDMDGNGGENAVNTIKRTIDLGPWRGYNNGITAIAPTTFENAMLAGAANYAKGVLSTLPGIWTLDKESSMKKYIAYGVGSIMTNAPKTAIAAFKSMGKCLASSDWRPTKATSDTAVEWKYDSGSCCLGAISDADFKKGGFKEKWRNDFSDRCRAPNVTPSGEKDCTPCSNSGKFCEADQVCENKNLGNVCRNV